MTTTTTTAHFRLDGGDFTRMVRERVLDDAPDHAWRLATCLGNDGDDDREAGVADAALGILRGTKKLVGNERQMKLVREHEKVTEAYRKRVDYVYAGRIKLDGQWYRPVAYVSDMGRRDMRNDHHKPVERVRYRSSTRGRGADGFNNRAWHYCGKNEIVVEKAVFLDPDDHQLPREVIFRACGERPHWLEVPRDAQAALAEFFAAGHCLEERSHSKWYGEIPNDRWDEPAHERNKVRMNDGPIDRTSPEIKDLQNDRVKRERAALKSGNVGPMNDRLLVELEFAKTLDEDDRPEVQHIRDDPQAGTRRTEMLARARKAGLGVGVLAEMLDEFDPTALAKLAPTDTVEMEADRLYRARQLAKEIADPEARAEAEDLLDQEAEALRQRKLAELRERILAQAGEDLIDLSWPATMNHDNTEIRIPAGTARIPRAPFLHWAFARVKLYDKHLPPWENVCRPGMKMSGDDPNHTDWVIGGGLDPDDRQLLYYPGPVDMAARELGHKFQDEFESPSDVLVIVDGPHALGPIVHGKPNMAVPDGSIVVLPNLHPKYLKATLNAAAVITEAGGMTAHLAQVGRERNLPIVLIENARERFKPGEQIVVDTASRSVTGLP